MIKVGMLVEIIDAGKCENEIEKRTLKKYIGHRGEVIGEWEPCRKFPELGVRYEIEGANPETHVFMAYDLRPIDQPRENKDITETLDNPIS